MTYTDEDIKRWECCDTQIVLANANYYYTKGQVDEKLDEIDGMTEEEVQTMIDRSIRTKADKTDVNALSGQVEDNTEAIANTYTKREVDNAITAATAPVNNTLTAHTANTSVHVTSQEKTYWNNKLDASAYTPTDLSNYYTKGQTDDLLDDKLDVTAYTPTDLSNYYTKQETQGVVNGAVSGKADTTYVNQIASQATDAITALTQTVSNNYDELTGQTSNLDANKFGYASYDSTTHRINFYPHDDTETPLAYVDASAFIKDGMVSNVEIINGNLVITFNSDAGKQPISIPLTDIFDPANYYTTAQTQSYVSGFTYDKATIDQKVAEGGTFDPDLYYDKTATDALLAAKADTATTYTKTEVDAALSGKASASDVAALENEVATKADTSAVTAVNDALTAHTANTNVHVTSAEKTTWNNKSDFSGDYNDLTNKPTIPTVPTNVSDFTNDAGYITNADITGKADTTAVTQVNDALTAHTANTTVHVTSAEKAEWNGKAEVIELTQAQYDALVTKDPDVLYVITDATAVDIANYYTKTETDTALATKQATLVSGTNIKTINNESILGSGNIDIQGGGATYTAGTNIDITNDTINCTLPITASTKNKNVTVGYGLNVREEGETSIGKYNVNRFINATTHSENTIFTVGNGGSNGLRHNALEIRKNGDLYFADTSNNSQSYYQKPMVRLQDMYAALGGLKLVSLTQAQYDALSTKDASTIYFING